MFIKYSAPFLVALTLLTSCASKSGTGAIAGGGIGAAAGVLISPTPAGALIGAGTGAVAGALIGAALDDSDQATLQQQAPQTKQRVENKQQLSLDDIKKMSQIGISDDKIIGTIQSTGSVYHLSTADIDRLKAAGVSDHVIDAMLQTSNPSPGNTS